MPPGVTRLGPLGERLLVDAVAEGAGGALADIAASRGLRRALARISNSLVAWGLRRVRSPRRGGG